MRKRRRFNSNKPLAKQARFFRNVAIRLLRAIRFFWWDFVHWLFGVAAAGGCFKRVQPSNFVGFAKLVLGKLFMRFLGGYFIRDFSGLPMFMKNPPGTGMNQPTWYRPIDVDYCIEQAKKALQEGDIDCAIWEYKICIENNPTDPKAYKGRGHALQDIGELDRAIADYDMAIKYSNSEDPTIFFGRADAYCKKREFDCAVADYSMAIKLDTDTTVAMPLISRGCVYFDMGDYSSAIADYTEAIRTGCNIIDNGNSVIAIAYRNRGLAYQKIGDATSASSDFAMASKLGYHTQSWFRWGKQQHKHKQGDTFLDKTKN